MIYAEVDYCVIETRNSIESIQHGPISNVYRILIKYNLDKTGGILRVYRYKHLACIRTFSFCKYRISTVKKIPYGYKIWNIN